MYITYSECMSVAFVIHHAKRMRLFILWSAQFYHIFPRYLIKEKIFEKKIILNLKCAFRFPLQIFLKYLLL